MSRYTFFASDSPLEYVKNPKIKSYSIEEAVKLGLLKKEPDGSPGWWENKSKAEQQKEKVIWVEKEEDFDELEISPPGYYSTGSYTKKQNIAHISIRYHRREQAQQLIQYITNHLKTAKEVELWDIWVDEEEQAVIKRCKLASLTEEHIETILSWPFSGPTCLVIEK